MSIVSNMCVNIYYKTKVIDLEIKFNQIIDELLYIKQTFAKALVKGEFAERNSEFI